ncbi:MAG: O-antigen ligase family protein [Thermomicrobiales bacterium]|nr:O-antigen ligase family protein [Thermomicrobiales bacterium]MCO5217727.1 O-antigen ligase family protein [Thermomicrobiales bacterium]MCO5225283.1 O-antigen ligase family protein [Thermomicrobiales bacterium]
MSERLRLSISVVFAGGIVAVAMAGLGVHWIVTLVALMTIAALAFLQPASIACLVILSIPVQSEVMLPFVRGEITVTQLLLFGLVPGWAIVFWKRRIWLDSIVIGFLLVLAALVVSFVAVETLSLWFQETYRWAIAGLFYLICRSVMTDWRDVRLAIWASALGIVGVSSYSLLQYLDVGVSVRADFVVGGAVRVYGSFGTPNTLAAYLEFTVPLLLAAVAAARFGESRFPLGRVEQLALLATAVFGLGIIGLTQSRGGWFGIAAALLVLWLSVQGRAKYVSLAVGVVILMGLLMTTAGQSQLERFNETIGDTTVVSSTSGVTSSYDIGTGRGALWAAARAMIADRPLTGIGAGEFDEHYREYVPSWIDRFPRGQAHNVWLQMGAQAGIAGIAGYAVWYAASVWSSITARRRTLSSAHRWIITGVLAILTAYTIHSLVDYLNVLSLGLQISAVTAIALNLAPEPLTRHVPEPSRRPLIPYPEHRECQNSQANPSNGWT